jgi:hypothetical protein
LNSTRKSSSVLDGILAQVEQHPKEQRSAAADDDRRRRQVRRQHDPGLLGKGLQTRPGIGHQRGKIDRLTRQRYRFGVDTRQKQ